MADRCTTTHAYVALLGVWLSYGMDVGLHPFYWFHTTVPLLLVKIDLFGLPLLVKIDQPPMRLRE